MTQPKSLAAAALALVLLAACGTGGDIFGGSPNARTYDISGTVDSVDLSSNSIYLTNVNGYNNSMLSNSGNSVRVFFDRNTPIQYQGRNYSPSDLERGDQLTAHVEDSGNRLTADSMTVTYNSASAQYPNGSYPSGSYPNGSTYPNTTSTVTGTVQSVDTSRRTIAVDRGYGSIVTLNYDVNTPVYWNGRTYRTTDLERGDQVSIRVQDLGRNGLLAQDITVTRNVNGTNGSGTYGQQGYSTLRGTVRYVDASRGTIGLDSTSWTAGFNSSIGPGATVVVRFDPNTRVSVNGQLYAVTNLEPGDVIDVQVDSGNTANLFARSITLVRDVKGRY